MRRRIVSKQAKEGQFKERAYVPIDVPDSLKEYADEMRLLKGVPLTYLLTDVSELPEESIRFFHLDINWTDALLDGAFSIGRVCARDAVLDRTMLKKTGENRHYADMPRVRRMHPNHKTHVLKDAAAGSAPEDYRLVSGFLLRSRLVNEKRGLHIYAYDREGAPKSSVDDGTPLPVLRMETVADNVLLALFHGEVYQVMLEEPKTGLRFGVSSTDMAAGRISRSMDLRSAQDGAQLGQRVESFCIDGFTDDSGRLHAGQLAAAVGRELAAKGALGTEQITPARFAFELIATAHRATFTAGDGWEETEHG